jgi:hypothetical protein
MYVITREVAEAYLLKQVQPEPEISGGETAVKEPGSTFTVGTEGMEGGTAVVPDIDEPEMPPAKGITRLTWHGEIAAQKWVNFYMKVLTKFASNQEMKLLLRVEISGDGSISQQKVEEMKAALRELGLDDDVLVG